MVELRPSKLSKFKSIKRGYWSLLLMVTMLVVSLFAELLVSNRAILVNYQGNFYFPSYGSYLPGITFGEDYQHEINYRNLQKKLKDSAGDDFVIMPPVPYSPIETDLSLEGYPPFPPSIASQHYLGTDSTGRDILARLVYGFRIAMFFTIFLLVVTYSVGIILGCLMGYWGGVFDLVVQRFIEVWTNINFLYVVIIVSSFMVPNLFSLVAILVAFGWPAMTWYMRTATMKEKALDYVLAAKSLGASDMRIVCLHIIPNTMSTIVTFIPFRIAAGISTLTALDFLGFGLPPPTPSWGELLQQGVDHLSSYWIITSVLTVMVTVLIMVTFIGEAVREVFDPNSPPTH